MGIWIISVTGIVALTLLVDIILPEGESNKYVKAVMSILTTFVLIQPLPGVLSENFDVGEYFEIDTVSADEGLSSKLDEIKTDYWENTITAVLNSNGVKNADIKVVLDEEKDFVVKVYLQNIVIADNQNHIFITKLITQIFEDKLGISAERISFYD